MFKVDATGECMIFAKEYSGKMFYQVGLSKKKVNGEYENGYMDVSFRKGVEVPNKTKINVTKGWLTFYINKDKRTVPQIFIAEFERDAPSGPSEPPQGFAMIEDDSDIPF